MRASILTIVVVALAGCAGSRPSAPAHPDLTSAGRVLNYEVTQNGTFPFVLTVTRNDDQGKAFSFNIGSGSVTGSVAMTSGALESAPGGMLNQFDGRAYQLTDQTSAWMARSDVRRLKAGETVQIDLGAGAVPFVLDRCMAEGYRIAFVDGSTDMAPTCTFVSETGALISALDDDDDPLILDMDTGDFSVALQTVR